jgi:hypothetical protein
MEDLNLTTSGVAARVTLLAPDLSEAYERVYVQLDSGAGLVHVLSEDAATHYLTIPIGQVLIEWRPRSELQPRPRVPAYGPGAFDQMGEQMQQMLDEMERSMGR